MTCQNKAAVLVKIAPLLMSQPRHQNQCIDWCIYYIVYRQSIYQNVYNAFHLQLQREPNLTYADTKRTCFYVRSYTCDERKKKNIWKCIQCNIWKCVHWTIFVDVHTYVSPHKLLHVWKGGWMYENLYNRYIWKCVQWIYENEYNVYIYMNRCNLYVYINMNRCRCSLYVHE